jgi:hypothetical protein
MSDIRGGTAAFVGLTPDRKMGRRRLRFVLLVALAGLCIAGAWLFSQDRYGIRHIPQSDAFCYVEVLAKPVVGATRFEIVDVACDTLAKDEVIRIYDLTPHKSRLGLMSNQETLLFGYDPVYDPAAEHSILPQITVDSGSKLTISIPRIASIWYKADRWNGRPINYEIGRIEYP